MNRCVITDDMSRTARVRHFKLHLIVSRDRYAPVSPSIFEVNYHNIAIVVFIYISAQICM